MPVPTGGILVRLRAPADDPALARLFEDMQAHYRRSCPPADKVLRDLAALPAGVEILVAETPQGVVGFAAFSAIYPGPGLASGFFLKELYVDSAFRGRGVGSKLMRAVARLAQERGHGRIDWTANRHDPRLRTYYENIGALAQEDKIFFLLADQALSALAKLE